MSGPEGQIGPMAETYAFALGGALLLRSPLAVLRTLSLQDLKPTRDNFLVRALQRSYLRQLRRCMDHRWLTLTFFATVVAGTVAACCSWAANSCRSWRRGTSGSRRSSP